MLHTTGVQGMGHESMSESADLCRKVLSYDLSALNSTLPGLIICLEKNNSILSIVK